MFITIWKQGTSFDTATAVEHEDANRSRKSAANLSVISYYTSKNLNIWVFCTKLQIKYSTIIIFDPPPQKLLYVKKIEGHRGKAPSLSPDMSVSCLVGSRHHLIILLFRDAIGATRILVIKMCMNVILISMWSEQRCHVHIIKMISRKVWIVWIQPIAQSLQNFQKTVH